jgi:hypothetical protein
MKNITIDWQRPLKLSENNVPCIDKDNIPAAVDDKSGVYYFARWFGEAKIPLYIGKSLTLRERLRQHLQRTDITDIMRGHDLKDFEVQKGQKYFHYGYFCPEPRQRAGRCLDIVEREMIRQAIQAGFPLVNINGKAPIPTRNIFFKGALDGFSMFPTHMEIKG